MDITPPSGDEGTQRLKIDDSKKGRTVEQTGKVEPYGPIAGSEQAQERPPVQRLRQEDERRQQERRQAERRSRDDDGYIDTRTPHDRRTHTRRRADRLANERREVPISPEAETGPESDSRRGIDIKI